MTQIIISDLEANLELDRQALSGVLGGKYGSGFKGFGGKHHRRHRFSKYYKKEYYREEYYSSNYSNKHCYTPKFDYYGCYC